MKREKFLRTQSFEAAERRATVLFRERVTFIRENYPFSESGYDIAGLINSGLDGMEVLETRDKTGDLETIVTYIIDSDGEGKKYLSIGLALTREESRQEGLLKGQIRKILKIAKKNNCEYISAIADTEEGTKILEKYGFDLEQDKRNGREFYKLDLNI